MDIVVTGFEEVAPTLGHLGFESIAATFLQKEVDLVVHLPAEPLVGDRSRLPTVFVDKNPVQVIGIEDIMADRTRDAAYWNDLPSEEWAAQLMAAWWQGLDWSYLESLPDNPDPECSAALTRAKALAARVVAARPPSDEHGP